MSCSALQSVLQSEVQSELQSVLQSVATRVWPMSNGLHLRCQAWMYERLWLSTLMKLLKFVACACDRLHVHVCVREGLWLRETCLLHRWRALGV